MGLLIAKRPFDHIFIHIFSIGGVNFLKILDSLNEYAQVYDMKSKNALTNFKKLQQYFSSFLKDFANSSKLTFT